LNFWEVVSGQLSETVNNYRYLYVHRIRNQKNDEFLVTFSPLSLFKFYNLYTELNNAVAAVPLVPGADGVLPVERAVGEAGEDGQDDQHQDRAGSTPATIHQAYLFTGLVPYPFRYTFTYTVW
jgi:hypothetical protein